jgi:hypothetical protein
VFAPLADVTVTNISSEGTEAKWKVRWSVDADPLLSL